MTTIEDLERAAHLIRNNAAIPTTKAIAFILGITEDDVYRILEPAPADTNNEDPVS